MLATALRRVAGSSSGVLLVVLLMSGMTLWPLA